MRRPPSLVPPRAQPLLFLLLLLWLVNAAVQAEQLEKSGASVVRRSQPVLLLNATFADMTPKQYLDTFWRDPAFYTRFLAKTGDIDIAVPKAWAPSSSTKGAMERTVVTKHPVHTRVPGLGIPSHVKSTKHQRLTEEKVPPSESPLSVLRIVEENVVEGVPFSDKFHVVVDWRARWLPPPPTMGARTHHPPKKPLCRLEVFLHVVFTGRFFLESVVARNSASETGDTLTIWEAMALERFARAEELVDEAGEEPPSSETTGKELGLFSCITSKRGRLGVWLTALCTSLVLLVTSKLGGLVAGAAPGGIH